MSSRPYSNNPAGNNGTDNPAAGQTSASGLIRREAMRLPAAPGQTAPRKAQRRATKPGPTAAPVEPLAAPQAAPAAPAPYPVMLNQAWQEIAAIPGASLLVRQQAAQAQNG